MQTSERNQRRESIDDLKRRAVRRAGMALGRFGHGVAYVVLRPRGESRCRSFVVAMRCGAVSVEEAAASGSIAASSSA